ncbi:hypothetical protein CONPUDRAFT_70691 [Coniophora puteana RWD-64-598 SS2]|uniref:Zinc finger RING-type eukaryotic domain-containing protein n=1 Tax=Coniophora puteana (strain RWD-64-598) TaxID=741705 RepID=A0A5M3MXB7_CONPW|nr:uncharacterized protein CONPUDRAFT_70691 [Coniophora puteana RWD-64-598 SS2]EIW83732.1 hypothetical protein CONPUDRAFT_70691 [Coniophora puteana RWD-64-598 SS2]
MHRFDDSVMAVRRHAGNIQALGEVRAIITQEDELVLCTGVRSHFFQTVSNDWAIYPHPPRCIRAVVPRWNIDIREDGVVVDRWTLGFNSWEAHEEFGEIVFDCWWASRGAASRCVIDDSETEYLPLYNEDEDEDDANGGIGIPRNVFCSFPIDTVIAPREGWAGRDMQTDSGRLTLSSAANGDRASLITKTEGLKPSDGAFIGFLGGLLVPPSTVVPVYMPGVSESPPMCVEVELTSTSSTGVLQGEALVVPGYTSRARMYGDKAVEVRGGRAHIDNDGGLRVGREVAGKEIKEAVWLSAGFVTSTDNTLVSPSATLSGFSCGLPVAAYLSLYTYGFTTKVALSYTLIAARANVCKPFCTMVSLVISLLERKLPSPTLSLASPTPQGCDRFRYLQRTHERVFTTTVASTPFSFAGRKAAFHLLKRRSPPNASHGKDKKCKRRALPSTPKLILSYGCCLNGHGPSKRFMGSTYVMRNALVVQACSVALVERQAPEEIRVEGLESIASSPDIFPFTRCQGISTDCESNSSPETVRDHHHISTTIASLTVSPNLAAEELTASEAEDGFDFEVLTSLSIEDLEGFEEDSEQQDHPDTTNGDTAAFSEVIRVLKGNLTCMICSEWLSDPYILRNCGHSVCKRCYLSMMYTTTRDHVAARTRFILPDHHRGNFSNEVIEHIMGVCSGALTAAGLPQPELKCPGCRARVTFKPIPNIALRNLAEETWNILLQVRDN